MKIKSKRNCYAKGENKKMILVQKDKVTDLPVDQAKILIGMGTAVEVKGKE